jgi:NAD(P)-dependent dehydrogenase (short-subunit alcohol dehydrogenase family)
MSEDGSPAMPVDGLLAGKVAVITGVGSGMGRSIARAFVEHGAQVALAARRPASLEAVGAELTALGAEPLLVPTDIADPEACAALVDETVERFGTLHIAVQNGHHHGAWASVLDADLAVWHQAMEVNLFGALHLARSAAPIMQEHGDGRIILVNTGGYILNPPRQGAYSTSKAALASLTRTLANELGSSGIRVNGVVLGPVRGDNFDEWATTMAERRGITFDEFLARTSRELALRQMPTPEECAGTVLYLASELARPVTGQNINVNGGQWFS